MMLIALVLSIALAGEDVHDIEISHKYVVQKGGVRLSLGMWNNGRGHCLGAPPSTAIGADGLPCTYHNPSPAIPWVAFEAHLLEATTSTVTAWVNACSAGSDFCAWLSDLNVTLQEQAWEQARLYIADHRVSPLR